VLTMACAFGAFAQQPRGAVPAAGAAATQVRIRKVPKLGGGLLVRSPQYRHDVSRSVTGSRKPREWAQFDVEYETAPEWLDELTIGFYVMTETRTPEGKKEFGFFNVAVTYKDIDRGEHLATAMLLPQAILRFGSVVAFGVEISIGGQVQAKESVIGMPGLSEDWWLDRRVIDAPQVVRRDGYLMDHAQSPFALAYIDDYEAVK